MLLRALGIENDHLPFLPLKLGGSVLTSLGAGSEARSIIKREKDPGMGFTERNHLLAKEACPWNGAQLAGTGPSSPGSCFLRPSSPQEWGRVGLPRIFAQGPPGSPHHFTSSNPHTTG